MISLREQPDYLAQAIHYFQQSWPEIALEIYQDCMVHSLSLHLSADDADFRRLLF